MTGWSSRIAFTHGDSAKRLTPVTVVSTGTDPSAFDSGAAAGSLQFQHHHHTDIGLRAQTAERAVNCGLRLL
ncbi:MAG: hypothetical protein IT162_00915 [Bryobacterales bacterium]|nr:hypothetical protein [Bryobacterales bacterium]